MGTGYFSHFMQKRGWKVSAIEKSPQARAFAKEHFELMVEDSGSAGDLQQRELRCDYAVACHGAFAGYKRYLETACRHAEGAWCW